MTRLLYNENFNYQILFYILHAETAMSKHMWLDYSKVNSMIEQKIWP